MAQKTISLPGIGEVVLAKRRGTRNLRLSISPAGRVRVGIPYWVPYQAGITFALSRADWIKKHAAAAQSTALTNGARIGKSYRLKFIADQKASVPRSRISGNQITIKINSPVTDPEVQKVAAKACERALKKDAEKLLPIRLRQLAKDHDFDYKLVRIKRLRSRWGSCSTHKEITLNYYLIQLPWTLIDYVILHELTHTNHMHHGPDFWDCLTSVLPQVKEHRKEIKAYKPVLAPETIA